MLSRREKRNGPVPLVLFDLLRMSLPSEPELPFCIGIFLSLRHVHMEKTVLPIMYDDF